MSVKGLLPLGAAGASALGGLFASDDAEAGVSGLVRNLPEAIAAINKAVRGGAGQRNPIGVLESIMHDTKYSNYDEMGEYALKVDGDTAGDYWKGEVQSMADQLRKAGGLTDEADGHLQAWLDDHLGRELGWRAPRADPSKPVKRAPKPQAPANNAMAAALAAAGVGAANAEEAPSMEWREWPTQDEPIPTSPAERGFTPWSHYEPQPTYWDRVTSLDTYSDALAPYARGLYNLSQTPVGQFIGERGSQLMEEYDSVGGFTRGVGRGMYGVLSGESPSQAWDAGVRVSNQTPEQSAQAVEQWATDRGWHPDDVAAAGFATEWMTNPLDYAGMGLFGKAAKVAR